MRFFSCFFAFISVHLCARRGGWFQSFFSVVEAVTQLDENFARIVQVESAKGQAVIQHHAAVSHVQPACGNGEVFAEILANGKIDRGMRGQIVQGGATGATPVTAGTIAVSEARAVVDVAGDECSPGKGDLAPTFRVFLWSWSRGP